MADAEDGSAATPAATAKHNEPKAAKKAANKAAPTKKAAKKKKAGGKEMGKGKDTGKSDKATGKKKQPRTYPQVTLEKALQVAYKIKEFNGGNPWPPADVATALGLGAKAPNFFYVTAAARDFGLTLGTRDTPEIELTPLGRSIVYAPDEAVERAKKKEAFLKVELFSRVLDHYKGNSLPPMKYLGNTLTSTFGVPEEHHAEFANVFKENCDYLGITSGEESPGSQGDSTGVVVVGETQKTTLKAFVIMPFVERNEQRAPGFFSEVLRSLITPAGVKAGFTVETANRQGSDVIQSTIINDLLEADLVIADLTDHNPNVLFELGLRMAAEEKKPVALIKAKGTGKVFDVDNMLRVWEYRPELWTSTIESDLPHLTQHIEAAWSERSRHRSYIAILRNPAQPTS